MLQNLWFWRWFQWGYSGGLVVLFKSAQGCAPPSPLQRHDCPLSTDAGENISSACSLHTSYNCFKTIKICDGFNQMFSIRTEISIVDRQGAQGCDPHHQPFTLAPTSPHPASRTFSIYFQTISANNVSTQMYSFNQTGKPHLT